MIHEPIVVRRKVQSGPRGSWDRGGIPGVLKSFALSATIFASVAILVLAFPMLTAGEVVLVEAILKGRLIYSDLVVDRGSYEFIGLMVTLAIAMTVSLNSATRSKRSCGSSQESSEASFDGGNYGDGEIVAALWIFLHVVGGLCLTLLVANWGDPQLLGPNAAIIILIVFLAIEASRAMDAGRARAVYRSSLSRGAVDMLKSMAVEYRSDLASKSSRLWWTWFGVTLAIGAISRGVWSTGELPQVLVVAVWVAFSGGGVFLTFAVFAREFVRDQVLASKYNKIFGAIVSCSFVFLGSLFYLIIAASTGGVRDASNPILISGALGVLISGIMMSILGCAGVLGCFGFGPFRHKYYEILHQSAGAVAVGPLQARRYLRPRDLKPHVLLVPVACALALVALLVPARSWVDLKFYAGVLLISILFFYNSRTGNLVGILVCQALAIAGCGFLINAIANISTPILVKFFLVLLVSALAACAIVSGFASRSGRRFNSFRLVRLSGRVLFEIFDRIVMQRRLTAAFSICRQWDNYLVKRG